MKVCIDSVKRYPDFAIADNIKNGQIYTEIDVDEKTVELWRSIINSYNIIQEKIKELVDENQSTLIQQRDEGYTALAIAMRIARAEVSRSELEASLRRVRSKKTKLTE
jgi:hypothetical protein